MQAEPPEAPPSALERALSLFTVVRAGEGVTALLLTFNIFLLLTAYYVIKPVREALILVLKSGAEYKSYMSGAIAVALLFAVPAYASFAKKLPRNRLVVGVTLFFVSHLLIFFALSRVPSVEQNLGLIFYLWVGIFNMMVVAQFWAFANDVYNEEQGKRLFAMVGIGASSGAAVGSAIAKFVIPVIGVYQMLLLCAVILGASAALSQAVHVRESRAKKAAAPVKSQLKNTMAASSSEDLKQALEAAKRAKQGQEKPSPTSDEGAFGMVLKHKYLTLLAAFSLLFTFVNTNGEYILGAIVSETVNARIASGALVESAKKEWIGAFYGDFFLYVNILGVVLQSFAVSRIVKWGGIRAALLFFPAIALLDAVALSIAPVLLTVRIGKTLENASDYSVNNTARNMLWLPTTRAMKYQAKQAVDTFFVRMGDVGSALLVWLLASLAGLGVRTFAIVNVGLVAVLLVVCFSILREQELLKKQRERGELAEE